MKCKALFPLICGGVLIGLSGTASIASAQLDSQSLKKRAEWLASQGLAANYHAIRAMFFETAQAPMVRLAEHLDKQAQELATYYTADSIIRLKQKGIDIIQAYRNGISPEAVVDRSELVVIAEILSADTEADLGDGYHSTITMKVIEVLKGQASANVLLLRETTGIAEGIVYHVNSGLMTIGKAGLPEPPPSGSRFVLHISRGLYPLRVLDRGKTPVANGKAFYIHQSTPFLVNENRLVKPAHSSMVADAIPRDLTQIRSAAKRHK